jgi:hypothetical protein
MYASEHSKRINQSRFKHSLFPFALFLIAFSAESNEALPLAELPANNGS